MRYIGKINCKKGELTFFALGLILVIFMLSAVFVEYFRLISIFDNVQRAVQRSVTACAISNSYAMFGGVKEGNSSVYELNETTFEWESLFNTDDVLFIMLDKLKNTALEGEAVVGRDDNGRELFRCENIKINVENPESLADKGAKIMFSVKYDLKASLKYDGNIFPPIKIKGECFSSWQPVVDW